MCVCVCVCVCVCACVCVCVCVGMMYMYVYIYVHMHIIALFYNRLHDTDDHVRQNTVMVLTHLILNDMIKVKGQISELALCLEDKRQVIVDRAKTVLSGTFKKGSTRNYDDYMSCICMFLGQRTVQCIA